ncbi:MAG TPA: ABC transporter ATP-binding protein [Syntrophorhabdaceae bacterium]|nr:ABC transporter ATP-binding protein [Syntrophorhabdaceae bacterium]HPU29525.1 ABC transporter ATP-binding protein [Syntrophorhabdaceae bacterium]
MIKEILFSLKDISFSYKDKKVLRGLNLDIEKGVFTGIIGPNGSGKSTLIRIMAGFLTPEEGTVLFKGQDIKKYHVKDLARDIAVLPQSMDVFYPYKVEDFIAIARYPHLQWSFSNAKKDSDFIAFIMEIMEISYLKDRRITELSQGEAQRVFIAQCIVQDPMVILLDEPVSHFDIKYQMKTLEILDSFNKEGMTVVVVLHDLNLASEFCKKIVLISEGAIYKEGEPNEVLTYENIEDVYKTVVVVKENPISGKPYIIPISKRYL